jgi:hypothetical protein
MRENDDDSPDQGDGGSLADGLGETAGPDDQSSTTEPYGDSDFDDSYGDDGYGDDGYGDDTGSTSGDDSGTTADDDVVILDEPEDTGSTSDNGGYGEGDGDGGVVIYEEEDDAADGGDDGDGPVSDGPDGSFDDSDLLAQDASPLEGIGYLIDEVRDALFGEDDEASPSAFDSDPAELESDTDLDLTGDGVVDTADLHEAGSVLDFDVE